MVTIVGKKEQVKYAVHSRRGRYGLKKLWEERQKCKERGREMKTLDIGTGRVCDEKNGWGEVSLKKKKSEVRYQVVGKGPYRIMTKGKVTRETRWPRQFFEGGNPPQDWGEKRKEPRVEKLTKSWVTGPGGDFRLP